MTAAELRIGNLLQTKTLKEPCRVYWISETGSPFNGPDWRCKPINPPGFGEYVSHQTEPISITEEWIVKLGGKITQRYEWGIQYDFYKYQIFDRLSDEFEFEIFECCGRGESVNIKHVHQLQNLYFGLTGEELKLKTT